MVAQQHLAQEATDRPGARLARGHGRPPPTAQVFDKRSVCVVVPEPSMPSRTISLPRIKASLIGDLLQPIRALAENP